MPHETFRDYKEMLTPENLHDMTGKITEQDIQEGIHCHHEQCPLAKALWRMFPGCLIFIDDFIEVTHKPTKTCAEIEMSNELYNWVDNFDNKKPVKPVSLLIKTDYTKDSPVTLNIDE